MLQLLIQASLWWQKMLPIYLIIYLPWSSAPSFPGSNWIYASFDALIWLLKIFLYTSHVHIEWDTLIGLYVNWDIYMYELESNREIFFWLLLLGNCAFHSEMFIWVYITRRAIYSGDTEHSRKIFISIFSFSNWNCVCLYKNFFLQNRNFFYNAEFFSTM